MLGRIRYSLLSGAVPSFIPRNFWVIDEAIRDQLIPASERDHASVEIDCHLLSCLGCHRRLTIGGREYRRNVSIAGVDDQGSCCLPKRITDRSSAEIFAYGRAAQSRKILAVPSSIGKKHSMRISCNVTSCGVPSVAIVVK